MPEPITALIAESLKISPERVVDGLEYGAIEEWDSLSHVNLMLKIEAKYGIEIDEDTMIELISVGAIRSFLENEA